MKIGGIILAAGMSSRMGSFKPLLPYKENTIIEQTVLSLLNGGVDNVVVVTGKNALEVEKILDKYPIKTKRNNDYETTGMIDSIQIGLKELLNTDAVFILPGDIPNVWAGTVFRLKEELIHSDYDIIIPRYKEAKGHPPLIRKTCYKSILQYQGTDGLREILTLYKENTNFLDIEDAGIMLDIDFKSDYEKLLNGER